ncbi:MAG TPA: phage tail sheath C-terminal domain-containing protein [Puia sp.]|nr:phage tail sheath C-terminal domain-containing protein [Puia sp.]
MADYKTPGVYIEEIPKLPPSIASVETAIPVFIGYTEKALNVNNGDDLTNQLYPVETLSDYEIYYGGPPVEPAGAVSVLFDNSSGKLQVIGIVDPTKRSKFVMHYCLQTYFNNGGGKCYIISVGDYTAASISPDALKAALDLASREREITLTVFPDSMNIDNVDKYYDLHMAAIEQAVTLQDRFVVMDVYRGNADWNTDIAILRSTDDHPGIAGEVDILKYTAVYFPRVYTTIEYNFNDNVNPKIYYDANINVTSKSLVDDSGAAVTLNGTLASIKATYNNYYNQAKAAVTDIQMLLPISAAMVGIYAQVDDLRGVWKAPANVNIINAVKPEVKINDLEQRTLNVDPQGGKSVNVVRSFTGRGSAIVWGARTLAGNDNEWRYISVRRFFIMVEQSVKNATEQFVFEPNDENTWVRIKSMIENYLTEQWKAGALMGTSTKEAYYVHIGLNQTMTEVDIWEGRLIVEIGLAAVRPAEFIILRFMHKMLSET